MGQPGGILRGILAYSLLLSLQVGFSAIVLFQVKRPRWLRAVFHRRQLGQRLRHHPLHRLSLMGVSDEFLSVPIAVLVIVIAVNIGRLIVKLEPLQVAMFVIAQMVGAVAGGFVLKPVRAGQ
jgi:hypothetical protein